MIILYDFISLQGSINGGAEYTRRVFDELIQKKSSSNTVIYALYNSKESFISDENIVYKNDVNKWVDINQYHSISNIIDDFNIDVFFVGIFQKYMKYDLSGIRCKSIVVIHDIASLEIKNSRLYLLKPETKEEIIKRVAKTLLAKFLHNKYKEFDNDFESHKDFLLNSNTHIITVSDFSRNSIRYNIPFLSTKKIKVLYSPLRKQVDPEIEPQTKNLIDDNKKYFLILSSKRWLKNADMALEVIKRFSEEHPEYYVVTTGSKPSTFKNQIALSYISDNQLAYVLKNATALIYPTLIEGFGYPPIESMYYGVPVFSSGMASLPEILGNAAITFSPFYKCDLYNQLCAFVDMDKNMLSQRALKQCKQIMNKQESDLIELIKLIMTR